VRAPAPTQHGIFIAVEVDESARGDATLAKKLEEACPVDIFAAADDGVQIVDENLDECVLCGLCLDASPPGSVKVIKLYDGGALLEQAA
jgi:NAD-dependent dihydropyrimidine dehydrogenase PreA subunit